LQLVTCNVVSGDFNAQLVGDLNLDSVKKLHYRALGKLIKSHAFVPATMPEFSEFAHNIVDCIGGSFESSVAGKSGSFQHFAGLIKEVYDMLHEHMPKEGFAKVAQWIAHMFATTGGNFDDSMYMLLENESAINSACVVRIDIAVKHNMLLKKFKSFRWNGGILCSRLTYDPNRVEFKENTITAVVAEDEFEAPADGTVISNGAFGKTTYHAGVLTHSCEIQ
jgi:hypothetical protein